MPPTPAQEIAEPYSRGYKNPSIVPSYHPILSYLISFKGGGIGWGTLESMNKLLHDSCFRTPWKINMEPENDGLEDDFPFQLGGF